jgi:hypothetical protein
MTIDLRNWRPGDTVEILTDECKITYYDANIEAVKPDGFCVQKDYSIYPTTFELSVVGKYVELRANNEQA